MMAADNDMDMSPPGCCMPVHYGVLTESDRQPADP